MDEKDPYGKDRRKYEKERKDILSQIARTRALMEKSSSSELSKAFARVKASRDKVAQAKAKLEQIQKRNKEGGNLPAVETGPQGGRYYVSKFTGRKIYIK